jgi:hypothetical protein
VTFTGGLDVLNAYFFRGIPQDDTGVILWPYGDLGFALHSGDGGLTSLTVNVGLWNSLHTGLTGSDGPGKLWYEADFYSTLGFGFGGGSTVGVTYTAYTSPNGMFGTVKELSFKFALDDSGALGPRSGQAVCGAGAGARWAGRRRGQRRDVPRARSGASLLTIDVEPDGAGQGGLESRRLLRKPDWR